MFLDAIRRPFSKPSTATPPERPVAAPEKQPVAALERPANKPEQAPVAEPEKQPVTAADRPLAAPVDHPATRPSPTSASHKSPSANPKKRAAPPTYSSRNESWRGPDTQMGRMVITIERNCGGLGMHPTDFEVLADWCSMGHMPSMRRMKDHFESSISPEGKEHLYGLFVENNAKRD